MPPLEPGAEVVTIERSGRPTLFSPAVLRRACEPSLAFVSRSARAAKLSRKARMPFDLTCSFVSTGADSATTGCSTVSGISSGSGGVSSASSGSSGSGSGSSMTGSGSGFGGGSSSRTSLATRSGTSISLARSGIGRSMMLNSQPSNRHTSSDASTDLRERASSS